MKDDFIELAKKIMEEGPVKLPEDRDYSEEDRSSFGVDDDWDDMDDENEFDEDISNVISLTDENGNEIKFEFLDLIEYEGKDYVVLLPFLDDDEEDDGEVVILQVEENPDDDTESYTSVDDERTLDTIFHIFKERFQDEFDFADEG